MPASLRLLLLSGMIYLPCTVHCGPAIEWTGVKNELSCADKADGYYTNPSSSEGSYYRCKDHKVVRCEKNQCNATTACGASGEGFFITPGTLCRGYYTCLNGTQRHFTCPPQAYFNMTSQFCVRTGGVCYELVCAGRVNGWYADKTHDCRRSYQCDGGLLHSLSSCPAGTRYNGNSCQPKDKVSCGNRSDKSAVAFSILPTDPCTNLPDGFQTQEDESCRDYVLCHSGQTIAKLRCAPGDYFDGIKCAPTKNTSCVSYCAGKPDGFTTDLRRQCRGYVNCDGEKIVEEISCKEGLLYNGMTCVSALLYRCPIYEKKNICSKLQNGYHMDYMTGCREYFYCNQGKILLRSECRDGKVWNGSDCVRPRQFLCQGPEIWPGCDGFQDGLYSDLSQKSQCKFYHYCSKGKRVRLSCLDGYVFNGTICVKKDAYECPKLDEVCSNKKDGYYTDAQSACRSYYYCLDGQKLTYVCPDNRVFNGSECVEHNKFNCSHNVNICKNKTNGYHPDKQTGCHRYVYCLQGVTITFLECPENNVFDGTKCILMRRDNCTKTIRSCDRAEDGFYSEPNSRCTKYFKCSNKKRTKIFTCREGKIFDGVKCVRYMCPHNASAQLQRRGDCGGKLGFFQDYGSKCKKYYFCISGAKTELSCKNGQVFNGEVCINEENYTCPVAK